MTFKRLGCENNKTTEKDIISLEWLTRGWGDVSPSTSGPSWGSRPTQPGHSTPAPGQRNDLQAYKGGIRNYAIKSVLRIPMRMFLGLPDPHPDPLVTNTEPAPDPSIIKWNTVLGLLYDILSLKSDVNVPVFGIWIRWVRTVCFWASRIRIRIR